MVESGRGHFRPKIEAVVSRGACAAYRRPGFDQPSRVTMATNVATLKMASVGNRKSRPTVSGNPSAAHTAFIGCESLDPNLLRRFSSHRTEYNLWLTVRGHWIGGESLRGFASSLIARVCLINRRRRCGRRCHRGTLRSIDGNQILPPRRPCR